MVLPEIYYLAHIVQQKNLLNQLMGSIISITSDEDLYNRVLKGLPDKGSDEHTRLTLELLKMMTNSPVIAAKVLNLSSLNNYESILNALFALTKEDQVQLLSQPFETDVQFFQALGTIPSIKEKISLYMFNRLETAQVNPQKLNATMISINKFFTISKIYVTGELRHNWVDYQVLLQGNFKGPKHPYNIFSKLKAAVSEEQSHFEVQIKLGRFRLNMDQFRAMKKEYTYNDLPDATFETLESVSRSLPQGILEVTITWSMINL